MASSENSPFEDAILAAIVNQFFATHPQSTDPNGYTNYAATPALNLAHQLFANNRDAIIKAVSEQLDIDKLAAEIAVQVTKDIRTEPPRYGGSYSEPSAQLRKDIRAAVIDKVAQAQADELRAAMAAEDATGVCPECGEAPEVLHLSTCTLAD